MLAGSPVGLIEKVSIVKFVILLACENQGMGSGDEGGRELEQAELEVHRVRYYHSHTVKLRKN